MNGITAAIQGRVTRDPELRYTSQGTAMLTLNIAVNDDKRTDDGPTEWVRCTLWEGLAEQLQDRLRKGSEVYVEGRLRVRTYQKQDGSQGVSVELSAWKCEALGAIGRGAPRRTADGELAHRREPAPTQQRMPAMATAVGGGRRLMEDEAWGDE